MARTVTDNPDEKRYEIHDDGELAGVLMYRLSGDTVTLLHTETLEGFEHRGIASELVRAVFDDLRAKGRTVVSLCPYVVEWLTRHPEYAGSS